MKSVIFVIPTLVFVFLGSLLKCEGMKVAIIGAGPGGLCAIHYLKKDFPEAEIVAFEIADDVGGTWRYSETAEDDEYGIPPMTANYKNLRTNLPKQVMEFSDFPIPESYRSFMKHQQFLQYLKDFTQTFDLRKHIKFRHLVTKVDPVDGKWLVKFSNLKKQESEAKFFDYVFVCNGHYSKYHIPNFPGQDEFKGLQMHSYKYRKPEDFSNKVILTIGAGPSGIDLTVDLSSTCRKVLFSHHSNFSSPLPENIIHKPDIERFTSDSAIFKDGTEEKIDGVIYCTGYRYGFDFLDENSGISANNGKVVHPLYKHIVNIEHPTMFFIGLNYFTAVIKTLDIQVRYCVALMKGRFTIPNKEDMLEFTEKYFELRKSRKELKESFSHAIPLEEPEYWESLSKESGIDPLAKVFSKIKIDMAKLRNKNILIYRDYDLKILDNESYVILKDGKIVDV